MAGSPIAGTRGSVIIGGVTVHLSKWSVTVNVDDHDTTNFDSLGYAEGVTGVREAEISFEGFWDYNANPHINPPGLRAGLTIGPVYLYLDVVNGAAFTFPLARVVSVPVQDDVRDKVMYSVNAKSQGIFYYPGSIAG